MRVLVALSLVLVAFSGCVDYEYGKADVQVDGKTTKSEAPIPLRERSHLVFEDPGVERVEVLLEPAMFPDGFGRDVQGYIAAVNHTKGSREDPRWDGRAWSYFGLDSCMTPVWAATGASDQATYLSFLPERSYRVGGLPFFLWLPPTDLVDGHAAWRYTTGQGFTWAQFYAAWNGHALYDLQLKAARYDASDDHELDEDVITAELGAVSQETGDWLRWGSWTWSHVAPLHIPSSLYTSTWEDPMPLVKADLEGAVLEPCPAFTSRSPPALERMELTDRGTATTYPYHRLDDALEAAASPATRPLFDDRLTYAEFMADYPDAYLGSWSVWMEREPPTWNLVFAEAGATEELDVTCRPPMLPGITDVLDWECSDRRQDLFWFYGDEAPAFDWSSAGPVTYEHLEGMYESVYGKPPSYLAMRLNWHWTPENGTWVLVTSMGGQTENTGMSLDPEWGGLKYWAGDLSRWGVPTDGPEGSPGRPMSLR